MADENPRIVQRALVLLVVMAAIAVTVLVALLRRSGSDGQPGETYQAATVVAPTGAGFPASIPWGTLYQLGDTLPSAPGWEIRYTATRVLAKRGSAKLPLGVLCEMLDERRQLRNFQTKLADGRVVPEESAAAEEVVIALKAVAEWSKQRTASKSAASDVHGLAEAVEKLTHSRNNVVRTRAQETLLSLKQNS